MEIYIFYFMTNFQVSEFSLPEQRVPVKGLKGVH